MDKKRLDIYLVELGLAPSRERAQSMIMEGSVSVNGMRVLKAGAPVKPTDDISVKEKTNPYVSRGGLKLHKAIEVFGLELNGVSAVDVGSSTGGFTDCMLKHGAAEVYSIDVGHGQLDWSLRSDERVHVLERRNARNMEPSWFSSAPDFATMDVSFISIGLILGPLYLCLADNATVMTLIKPQFEAGRDKVGKNGVVRAQETHIEVITRLSSLASNIGFNIEGLDFSPITGPKGNIEFLLLLSKGERYRRELTFDISGTVAAAHSELD